MPYKYNPSTNQIEQQPEMKFPSCDDEVDENLEGTFKERLIEYHQHVSNDLKTYPVSGITPESWLTGRDIPESEFKVEYEHGGYCKNDGTKPNLVALPIKDQPKEESQEELWKEVVKNVGSLELPEEKFITPVDALQKAIDWCDERLSEKDMNTVNEVQLLKQMKRFLISLQSK